MERIFKITFNYLNRAVNTKVLKISYHSHQSLYKVILSSGQCLIHARPGILKPSGMDNLHPIVRAGLAIGLKTCSSPASYGQGLLQVPALTIGRGDPDRSHIANEYIFIDEISDGISTYIVLLNSLLFCLIRNPEHNLTEF
jgi:acetylornithine deacetylase